MCSIDHTKILHTSRQLHCRDVCKILFWLKEHIWNQSTSKFGLILNSIEIFIRMGARSAVVWLLWVFQNWQCYKKIAQYILFTYAIKPIIPIKADWTFDIISQRSIWSLWSKANIVWYRIAIFLTYHYPEAVISFWQCLHWVGGNLMLIANVMWHVIPATMGQYDAVSTWIR